MVSFKIEVKKRDITWVVFLAVVLAIGVVYAYGTSSPSVMGHSPSEIDFSFPIEELTVESDGPIFAQFCDKDNHCIEVIDKDGTDDYGVVEYCYPTADTCNGNVNVGYTCPNGVSKTCLDVRYVGPSYLSTMESVKRTITCYGHELGFESDRW